MSARSLRSAGLHRRLLSAATALPPAVITGGTVTEYTEGGITYRQHLVAASGGALEVVSWGWVETLLIMGGGGQTPGTGNPAYPSGGGGGGGSYLKRFLSLRPQTITATTIGGSGQSTVVVLDGVSITCGYGGSGGAGGGGAGSAGGAGANGGGNGGAGQQGYYPGPAPTPGVSTLPSLFDLNGQQYGQTTWGAVANTGNGAGNTTGAAPVAGSSGCLLLRYPLLTT